MQTSPNLPRPPIQSDDAVANLRRVFMKWNEDMYPDSPSFLAYLLNHHYSSVNLAKGAKGLKGSDAHLVSRLVPMSEELGFSLGLAKLRCKVTGTADCESGDMYYNKRARRGYHDDYGDYYGRGRQPRMEEVMDKVYQLTNAVTLEGKDAMGGQRTITVDEDDLIPREPFEDMSPDKEEYEGYMGNYPGDVMHCKYSIIGL
ncbi:hypothetical protein CC1G_15664 [Coprinopsis cinerea okayama7|uniref:Uncharacterized protein n=1 Tax=Coprinopsis cinerea (strain Okayama-7 / 130 / ATCC MYA-4618 / FGSC 9003) TaxID=240176 RepID=D6RQC4_COPC7|nr:hypothetical protein CC1G_15664 [Coprinopsis cinerea okayama7\|eukprot:XP_002910234.1 hypothetical protein CC1G_15664 [Coprinopsis cinerea okayama7\